MKIPGVLVDCVVVAEKPEYHMQTFATPYNPAFAGEIRVPQDSLLPMAMSARKIIARRAAMELQANAVVNLGIGMPEGIAAVAAEERVVDLLTLTAEPGVVAAFPPRASISARQRTRRRSSTSPTSSISMMAAGSTRPSSALRRRIGTGTSTSRNSGRGSRGAGGFINISQTAKAVYFVGTFTAGEAEIAITDAGLKILKEGGTAKFVEEVEHRTFSGAYALKRGQPVLYITERCVMQLTPEGMEVIEIAPGIDLDRDILARMAFRPIVKNPRLMDLRLFREDLIGLRDAMLALPISGRFSYDAAENLFFINFERLSLKSMAEIDEVRMSVTKMLAPVGAR